MSRDPTDGVTGDRRHHCLKGTSGLSLREQRSVGIRQGEAGAMSQEAELESHKWGKTWLGPMEPSLQNRKHDTRGRSDPVPKAQPCFPHKLQHSLSIHLISQQPVLHSVAKCTLNVTQA